MLSSVNIPIDAGGTAGKQPSLDEIRRAVLEIIDVHLDLTALVDEERQATRISDVDSSKGSLR